MQIKLIFSILALIALWDLTYSHPPEDGAELCKLEAKTRKNNHLGCFMWFLNRKNLIPDYCCRLIGECGCEMMNFDIPADIPGFSSKHRKIKRISPPSRYIRHDDRENCKNYINRMAPQMPKGCDKIASETVDWLEFLANNMTQPKHRE